MRFDDLDKTMRVFESNSDVAVLPDVHMVARIDGRNFTRLTKEVHKFEAPFDEQLRVYMLKTVECLMTDSGFNIIYGYTQSDEISLLFTYNETTFNRKIHKYNSILASIAASTFSFLINDRVAFDCRISQLPSIRNVVSYFRWRQEDAHRNALNGHCYWLLRKQGMNATQATKALLNKSVAEKNDLLFQNGINFNTIPNWQKRGCGMRWNYVHIEGRNPLSEKTVTVKWREIETIIDLPIRDDYERFIHDLVVADLVRSGVDA